MPDHKTFARVAIEQAAANAVRVDLVLDAVTPHTDTRLISRALGLCPDGLALATPASANGRKVYLPGDWELGLSFELGRLWFQARTVVLRHTFFDCGRGCRADAVLVRSPDRLTSCNRRRSVRHRALERACAIVIKGDSLVAHAIKIPMQSGDRSHQV